MWRNGPSPGAPFGGPTLGNGGGQAQMSEADQLAAAIAASLEGAGGGGGGQSNQMSERDRVAAAIAASLVDQIGG